MTGRKSNYSIAANLMLAVFLWGGSNAGTKYLVTGWPPIWVGCTRLLIAGIVLQAVLKWTRLLGVSHPPSSSKTRELWLRGGLSLGVYIVVFNLALKYTSASHVALYLGASPVWALLWEGIPERSWQSARRFGAAALALLGVLVLFWPSLKWGNSMITGELLGLSASVLWANYGRQGRRLGASMSGAEVGAQSMWRAGLLLFPLALVEVSRKGLEWRAGFCFVQGYCIIAGGVIAYALWNGALRHWPTSQVFLFNNLISPCTMAWAWFCLGEPVTPTFWIAMALIIAGVLLGQAPWEKLLGANWPAPD